jgi:3-oxoacyl-[acyl-carrier protein] reductase
MLYALVTGTSGGLGSKIVLSLLQNGVIVFGVYNNTEIDADILNHINFMPIKADLESRSEIANMIQTLISKTKKLDYLVNCAGITLDRLLIKCTEEEWDKVMAINLSACFYIIKEALPLLRGSDYAHILNISSISGIKGNAGQAAYSASKAALIGMTLSMAIEFSILGVRVNVVLPGYLPTKMGKSNPKAMTLAQQNSLLSKLSLPSDIGDYVVSILKMRSITGQVFNLDSRII